MSQAWAYASINSVNDELYSYLGKLLLRCVLCVRMWTPLKNSTHEVMPEALYDNGVCEKKLPKPMVAEWLLVFPSSLISLLYWEGFFRLILKKLLALQVSHKRPLMWKLYMLWIKLFLFVNTVNKWTFLYDELNCFMNYRTDCSTQYGLEACQCMKNHAPPLFIRQLFIKKFSQNLMMSYLMFFV